MVTNRTRISALICLALTLGMVVNVFALQGTRRQPMAAIAETFPSAPGSSEISAAKLAKPAATRATASDPARQLQANADADLSVRTADAGRAATDMLPAEAAPTDTGLVTAIQRGLADLGYMTGTINGKPGLITRAALMAFEFDQHFQLTGEPGEEALRRVLLGLEGPAKNPVLPPSDKAGRIIAGVQRLLQRLGYDPGPVNAQLDDATRKALRLFEADAGFVPKGRISGEVVAEIARRSHARIEVYDEALSR